jgi:ATP/maltotriose-dependent transcriptional regulator MalT
MLFACLQEGLQVPLTLLCALARLGKTTLLASWLGQVRRERDDLAAAWLSQDRDDGKLAKVEQWLSAWVLDTNSSTLHPNRQACVLKLVE